MASKSAQGNGTPSGDGGHENKDLPPQEKVKAVSNGSLHDHDDLPPQRGRHDHELKWITDLNPYKCCGCRALGANQGFKCLKCPKFVLHQSCACLPDESADRYYSTGRNVKFGRKTNKKLNCDACGQKILGFVFQTEGGDMKYHPLCFAIPPSFQYSQFPDRTFQRIEDEHKRDCMRCKKKTLKWKYHCEGLPGGVYLDMNCALLDYLLLSNPRVKRLQPTWRDNQIVSLLNRGCKYVADKLVVSFCQGLGQGTAYFCCPSIDDEIFGNNDDGAATAEEQGDEGAADGNQATDP